LGLTVLTHNLEVCLENETSGGSSRLARVAFSSQSARAAVFNTPRHAMSSGRLETKKSGDFYWSKDEVRPGTPCRVRLYRRRVWLSVCGVSGFAG
jgi:hypothetical protein